MNIFLCCLQGDAGPATKPYRFWRDNLAPALESLGHQVIEPEHLDFVQPLLHAGDRHWIEQNRAAASESLVEQVKKTHHRIGVDAFVSYFYSLHVLPDAIHDIRQLGIPTVNFFCDNLRQFEEIRELAPHFDLNWVPEAAACVRYRAVGAPYLHLPMGAHPPFYTEPARDAGPELQQVTFVGSVDGLRTRLFAHTLASGIALEIYGTGWKPAPGTPSEPPVSSPLWPRAIGRLRKSFDQHRYRIRHQGLLAEVRHLTHRGLKLELLQPFEHVLHPAVPRGEMVSLARRSAIFLGVNRCPHPGYPVDAPLVYSRLRDIEGPMMGACYLTEYCEDLESLYEIGREVAVYRSGDELVEQSRRLLGDPRERRELRRRGQAAALSRHTWQRRFERLFASLGLAPAQTWA